MSFLGFLELIKLLTTITQSQKFKNCGKTNCLPKNYENIIATAFSFSTLTKRKNPGSFAFYGNSEGMGLI